MHSTFVTHGGAAVPIWFADKTSWPTLREQFDDKARAFMDASGFEPKAERHVLLPDATGRLAAVLVGCDEAEAPGRDPFSAGRLPALLPRGVYRFANAAPEARLAALAFALGAYRFGR